MKKNLRFLLLLGLISKSLMGMDQNTQDDFKIQIIPQAKEQQENEQKEEALFTSRQTNPIVIQDNKYSRRSSIVLHNTPSKFGTIMEKLKSTKNYRKLNSFIEKNSSGIKVSSLIVTVLLLHFFYAEESSITYSAQIGAGKSILDYFLSKKINLIPLLLMFEALASAIYIGTKYTGFSTGLATVFDIACICGVVKLLQDNVDRRVDENVDE